MKMSDAQKEAPKEPLSEEKPPRVDPRLTAGPRHRELYWCDFPLDAQLPEFWKTRPVVIIGTDGHLTGAATVIPCSSQKQPGNKWAHPLNVTIDGEPSWAICDKPCTVAVSRLSPDKRGKRTVTQDDFTVILTKLHDWLPKLKPPVPPPTSSPGDGPGLTRKQRRALEQAKKDAA